jgi:hypothetical protein
MNMEALSYVKFGDKDGLGEMLFENGVQHLLFYQILADNGILVPKYPITDADPAQLDDWLFVHNQEHQALASVLNLDNPFQLLDADWNVEDDFYDWIGVHQTIHQQIASALGV